ncbi:hypothetical protein GGH13_007355 [Coemansia sp. S155-1]|nr:hypothetical protein GGH13_007355 [Coemansia sp. S155-1]
MDLNTRLDQSLDQIIKESRGQKQAKAKPQQQAQAGAKRRSKGKAAVAKQVPDISARLSATGATKPARRTKNTVKAAAPAQSARTGISARLGGAGGVVNKVIGNGKASGRVGKAAKAESGGRLAGLAEKKRVEEQKHRAPPPSSVPAPKVAPNVKISIRGEAGPATVFISNLDSEASPEDVMTCFRQFGAIKNCTLLYDRMGKASGHAEVTYAAKQAAEEAAAKLNNALADGRRLSVQLIKAPSQPPAQGQSSAQGQQQQGQSSRGGSSSSHRDKGWNRKRRTGGNQMDID